MCSRMQILASSAVLFVIISAPHVGAQVKPVLQTEGSIRDQMAGFNTNRAEGRDYKVHVKSVVEKSTSADKVVYEIIYSYDFKGRDTVYVDGLGTVPAKGKFRYMTSGRKLEFRQFAFGPLIANVWLEETKTIAGDGATDLPKESDFPQFFRSSTWVPPPTFPDTAVKVIQNYFPSGYNTRQEGQVSYYITTYSRLPVADGNLRSQIAVRISQPYDREADKFNYHIQFVHRDRPRLSDTWRYGNDCNPLTITAALELINKLVGELSATGGNRQ
jgi:hypothetical protein